MRVVVGFLVMALGACHRASLGEAAALSTIETPDLLTSEAATEVLVPHDRLREELDRLSLLGRSVQWWRSPDDSFWHPCWFVYVKDDAPDRAALRESVFAAGFSPGSVNARGQWWVDEGPWELLASLREDRYRLDVCTASDEATFQAFFAKHEALGTIRELLGSQTVELYMVGLSVEPHRLVAEASGMVEPEHVDALRAWLVERGYFNPRESSILCQGGSEGGCDQQDEHGIGSIAFLSSGYAADPRWHWSIELATARTAPDRADTEAPTLERNLP